MDARSEPAGGAGPTVDPVAALRGALAGLAVIVPVTVAAAVVDRWVTDLEDSAWSVPFTLAILAAYLVAGLRAGLDAPTAPLTNGALAGVGAVALWIPVRVAIWAVRESDRGLVSGDDPALPAGELFGNVVLAAVVGMAGALLGARRARRRDNGDGGEPAGRPRHGFDRAEERPDSTGQGAG